MDPPRTVAAEFGHSAIRLSLAPHVENRTYRVWIALELLRSVEFSNSSRESCSRALPAQRSFSSDGGGKGPIRVLVSITELQ